MPSSVVLTMRYNPAEHILTIVYRNNRGTYRYFDVPPEEWTAFRAAESKGTYLNQVFKVHAYKYEKVTENAAGTEQPTLLDAEALTAFDWS